MMGVNLNDGLDGLATGAAVMSFLAFVLIGVWDFLTTISKCVTHIIVEYFGKRKGT